MEKMTTKDVLRKYKISRQTLHNWIVKGQISEPQRDWRGWRVWDEYSIKEIEQQVSRTNTKSRKLEISTFSINNRRYLGSKYKLLDFIDKTVADNCVEINSVADIFAGTGVVADMFFNQGKSIIVNDLLYSNILSYTAFFKKDKINKKKIKKLIEEFNSVEVKEDNYFSYNFGNTFFTLENARKIGYIREKIENKKNELTDREYSILLTSLLYATDKVANTCGHYDAYREVLDSTQKVKLLMPEIKKSKGNARIYREDANELVRKIQADLVYIDTPYNSRQYGDAYHLLENLAEWKQPSLVGKAKKMTDRAHIKSRYCTVKAPEAFSELIADIRSRYILVSYNNMAQKGAGRSNAKISNEEIIEILSRKGNVQIFETDYSTFTTGKTDIHNHKELLYLCTCWEE